MKLNYALSLVIGILVALVPATGFGCFDTYLFVSGKRGMVYPIGIMAIEGTGEYRVEDATGNSPDLLGGAINLYYGLSSRASVQIGFISDEKDRDIGWKWDKIILRGVWGLYRSVSRSLTWDFILEHHEGLGGGSHLELSSPGIISKGSWIMVVHPVVAFSKGDPMGLRGHTGVFRLYPKSLIGLGAEYESAQSSAYLGRRLVKGQYGTSLFLGSQIGSSFYLQNEIIKGWGPNSRNGDIGFSLVLKALIPVRFIKR